MPRVTSTTGLYGTKARGDHVSPVSKPISQPRRPASSRLHPKPATVSTRVFDHDRPNILNDHGTPSTSEDRAEPAGHDGSKRAIGAPPRSFEARWEQKFRALSRFHAQRGHVYIQNKDTACADVDDGLYAWVLQQRQLRKQGRLTESRVRRLNALGFVWDVQQYTWRHNMELLRVFFKEHGHIRVWKGWDRAPQLYLFTRKVQQSSKVAFTDVPHATRDDIEDLYAMGAIRRRRKSWEEREGELQAALDSGTDLSEELKAWLRMQRYACRQGTLSDARRRRLVALGIEGIR